MRIFLVVLDGFGIGEMPDAELFDDVGSDTYGHIVESTGLMAETLVSLGLNNIEGVKNKIFANGRQILPVKKPLASYGRLSEKTFAKDTTAGHYEIAGLVLDKPYKTYKKFPPEIVAKIEEKAKVKFIGNEVASGTEIINRLGVQHLNFKCPILYTSQGSVMQIAADISVFSVERLYEICKIAREIMTGDYAVGRVIARPFTHVGNVFTRTEDRRDFALEPPGKTLLDDLYENGVNTIAVGKISDIFCGRGIRESIHTANNVEGIAALEKLTEKSCGFVFVNLVDTDMLYGHRNDVEGYAKAIKYFDERLSEILQKLREDDILIITADHGCDPVTPSTDHSREYVPLLIYGKKMPAVDLGTINGFDCISYFIKQKFGLSENSIINEKITEQKI